jgi:hypothetical protein
MFLDAYQLRAVTVQLQYSAAFEVWDRAGAIARQLSRVWPDIKLIQGQPNQQALDGDGVRIETGLTRSTVVLSSLKSIDEAKIQRLKETYEIWCRELALTEVRQVSTLAQYAKLYASMRDANRELLEMRLARWPKTKVFDQPEDAELNTVDVAYRFEDEKSFSFLRLRTERVKFEAELDPEFVDEPRIERTKYRLLVEFDRGLKGAVNVEKFRIEDWLKGYQHVLRRDIEKVLMADI